MLYLAPFDSPT